MSDWPRRRLTDVTVLLKRGKAPLYADEGLLVINQKCVRSGNTLDLTFARRTDSSTRPVADFAVLRDGDVLVNSTGGGTLGRAALFHSVGEPATVDSHVTIVRGDPAHVVPEFLGIVLSTRADEIEAAGSGSTNQTELSARALGNLSLPLPPLDVQRRIVDLVTAVDAQVQALNAEADALSRIYENSLPLLWQDQDGNEAASMPLSQVMSLDIERVTLERTKQYQLAGVLNAGQGLIDKGSFVGSQTEYSAMNRLRAQQVVMRKLTAWEGPISVVPDEFHGFVASNEFPTFSLSHAVAPGWMRHVCRTTRLWTEMRNRVTGTVQRRKRLKPEQLLAVELPIPDPSVQRRVAAGLDALLNQRALIVAEGEALRVFRSALLASLLNQSIILPESYDHLLVAAS